MARAFAVAMSRPSRKPLLILTPSPVYAPPPLASQSSGGCTVRTIGSWCCGGEGPVALVLGRHGHDRPGPVPHEDVVGHVERDGLAGERVDDVAAGEGATLAQRGGVALGHALDVGGGRRPGAQLVDGLPLVGGGQLVHERVLGGHDGIGHAEAGVGPGREDPDRHAGAALDGEVELGALGPADPVALHGLGPLGPLEVVEGLEELVGVLGDAEEPLLQVALLDDVARAVAGAVGQHLLVGQHGLAAGAPVDRGQRPVGQARPPRDAGR